MGRPAINLTGQTFGRLTVIERDITKPMGAGKSAYWLCECECGNKCSIRTDKLTKDITKSCGCLSKEIRTEIFLKDLSNQKYGKLTVVDRDNTKPCGKGYFAYWNCICDCGNKCSIRGDHLRNGTTSSCGCINSKGELKIFNILKDNNISFSQQYTFKDLKVEDYLRFDFAIFDKNNNLSFLIEYQGEQHYKPFNFDTEERFKKRLKYDELKREYCKKNNIQLLEIPYTDFDKISIDYIKKMQLENS